MSLELILIIYAILLVLACFAFIEQRAELEIGRVIGFDVRKIIMPIWCACSSYLGFIVVGIAIYTFIYYSWMYAVGMAAVYFIVPACMPISESAYEGVFKKLGALCKEKPEVRDELIILTKNSGTYNRLARYL